MWGSKTSKGRGTQGLELKIARLRVGLKQFELAAKVGIASTQLCEIETGRREASPELLERILTAISSVAEVHTGTRKRDPTVPVKHQSEDEAQW